MIAIALYRGEKIKFNARSYVYIKPPKIVKVVSKDRVFVMCNKQPKGFDTNYEDEERNNLIKALVQDGSAATIKSSLTGEEGRLDTEVARELNKVNQELRNCFNDLKGINQDAFAKGLTNKNFIPDVRNLLKAELAGLFNTFAASAQPGGTS